MSVSVETAEKILRTLEGGRVPYEWRGTLKNGVEVLGPGPTMLNFSYQKLREQESLGGALLLKKRALNDRLMFAERGFLDADGAEGSQRFNHLVYGPHNGTESKLVYFSTIMDAISQSTRMPEALEAPIQHEIWRVARAIQRAAYALNGELTS